MRRASLAAVVIAAHLVTACGGKSVGDVAAEEPTLYDPVGPRIERGSLKTIGFGDDAAMVMLRATGSTSTRRIQAILLSHASTYGRVRGFSAMRVTYRDFKSECRRISQYAMERNPRGEIIVEFGASDAGADWRPISEFAADAAKIAALDADLTARTDAAQILRRSCGAKKLPAPPAP